MYMLDDYYDNESIDVKREIKMEYDDSTHVKKEIKEEDDTDDFYDADADELSLLIDLTVADAVELQKAKILQAQANERIIEELSDDIKVNQVLIQAQDAMILMLDRKSADYVQVMNEKTRLLQEKESMQEKLNETQGRAGQQGTESGHCHENQSWRCSCRGHCSRTHCKHTSQKVQKKHTQGIQCKDNVGCTGCRD
jgi:hypothetical protein